MMFKSSLIATALAYFAASSSMASASPVPQPLDVWNPTITSPVAGTVWVIGTTVNVTWYAVLH